MTARRCGSPTDSNVPPGVFTMMTEALATTTPVLAAGWSLLYMMMGGGLGGAILIFLGLKAIGR